MSTIGAVLDILTQHSDDVEKLVAQLGGVGNLIKVAPTIVRLMDVVIKHKDDPDPAEAGERIKAVLYYNDETKASVAAFQKKHGLYVDGIIGNQTWHTAMALVGPKVVKRRKK